MRKSIFLIPVLSICLSGCFDNDHYDIENGVRLNKKTGEMSLISGEFYKKIEEFKVTQTESEAKLWPPMEIPLGETNKGTVNIKTKYKDGYILYMSNLLIKDVKLSTQEYKNRYFSSQITVKFDDKDGFATDAVIKLPISESIANYSAAKEDVHLYWESKIPSTLKNYESISEPTLQWVGFK